MPDRQAFWLPDLRFTGCSHDIPSRPCFPVAFKVLDFGLAKLVEPIGDGAIQIASGERKI